LLDLNRPPILPYVPVAKEEVGSASVVKAPVKGGAEASVILHPGTFPSRRVHKSRSETCTELPYRTGLSTKKVVTTPSVQPDEEEVEEIEFVLIH